MNDAVLYNNKISYGKNIFELWVLIENLKSVQLNLI